MKLRGTNHLSSTPQSVYYIAQCRCTNLRSLYSDIAVHIRSYNVFINNASASQFLGQVSLIFLILSYFDSDSCDRSCE